MAVSLTKQPAAPEYVNGVPALCDRCNSWIIADNGTAVLETWDRAFAERIASRNTQGVEIYTSLQWLQHFNATLRQALA
jgi:hypothetical protein